MYHPARLMSMKSEHSSAPLNESSQFILRVATVIASWLHSIPHQCAGGALLAIASDVSRVCRAHCGDFLFGINNDVSAPSKTNTAATVAALRTPSVIASLNTPLIVLPIGESCCAGSPLNASPDNP